MAFMIFVMDNSDYNIYDITPEQKEALTNPSHDPFTLLNKLLTLASINSTYAFLAIVSGILTILFILAVLTAINEFVPFT